MRDACAIAGLSTYVPPRVLTNADLEKLVETTDEWILQRTGIRERHIVEDGMATSDMAKEASLGAIRQAGITPADIGFIVVGTTTPDTIFPSTACVLQDKIGATQCWGFDLGAACSGFTYALTVGMQMVGDRRARPRAGRRRRHDVEHHRLHAIARPASCSATAPARRCCRRPREDEPAIIDFAHEIDGSGGPALCMPAGGSRMPASHETVDNRMHYVKQDGQAVFKFAVRKTEEISRRRARAQRAAAVGGRSVRLAPGEPPHHQRRGRAARPAGVEGHHQSGAVRQHDRRDDSAGARGCRWPTGGCGAGTWCCWRRSAQVSPSAPSC